MSEYLTPSQRANNEAKYIADFLSHAATQRPKTTLMFYTDGTDEFLNQYFVQTRLPNNALSRLLLVIKAVYFLVKEWSMIDHYRIRDLFDPIAKDEALSELLCFRYFNFAFGYMTEAEAEMQANVEAHLYHFELFDDHPTTFDFGPLSDRHEFPYPAIQSRHYYGWGLILPMILHTNYRFEEPTDVSA